MFLVTSAVGFVTSGFMQQLFGINSTMLTVSLVFGVCILILITNNFKILDGLIKVIGIVLLVSTLMAFFMVLGKGQTANVDLFSFDSINTVDYFTFLIPLMGWMPTAVDLSAWNSLWTVERIKQSGYHPKLKETLFDFNFGYILSALLAICFVTLGAFIMFGIPGKSFSASPVAFSGEVISLYTSTFGPWAYTVIAISAFSIMFGTCVAVFDGYSRAMSATLPYILNKNENSVLAASDNPTAEQSMNQRAMYRIILLIIGAGAFLIIYTYQGDMKGFKKLIDLATSVSFIIAPVIAILNLKLVSAKYVGEDFVPPVWIRILAYLGIVFLSVFTLFFIFKDFIIS